MASIRFLGMTLLLIAAPQLTTAAPARITVRNIPIHAAAVIDRGRILLPLRATFEALNSTVWYERKTGSITARNILHVLQMRIGTRSALLDGHKLRLTAAPIILNGCAYVPFALAAQAMGAIIQFDSRSNSVAVNGSQRNSSASQYTSATAVDLMPSPDTLVHTAYPIISAALRGAAQRMRDVTLLVDGVNVTHGAVYDGHRLTYLAHTPFSPGHHTVALTARTASGQSYGAQWSFRTSGSSSDLSSEDANAPPMPDNATLGDLAFSAPLVGAGYVQVCGPTYRYPFWNGGGRRWFRARIAVPNWYGGGGCPIAAFFNGSGSLFPIPLTPGNLYVTGNPLSPIGQYQSGPLFVPFVFTWH